MAIPEGKHLPSALSFADGRALRPIPIWARWLIEAGTAAVEAQASLDPAQRLVMAISVPVRDFAAAFVAAGATASLYRAWAPEDAASHFEKLAKVPAGTYVAYKAEKGLKSGILDGIKREKDGELYVSIGGGKYLRRWNMCGEIHPLSPGEAPWPGKKRISEAGEFVQAALGVAADNYALSSSVTCLLVGPKAKLIDELTGQRFAAGPRSGTSPRPEGTLQDLLRCRAAGGGAGSLFRTDIAGAQAPVSEQLGGLEPGAVVLDGPSAFLRWRHEFRSAPLIAILDRTAPGSSAAADAFIGDRAKSLRDTDAGLAGPVPSGVEVLAFVEEVACF